MVTLPAPKTLTQSLQAGIGAAASLPSLSQDPAWATAQQRVLATLGVTCIAMWWLGKKGHVVLAIGLGTAALVYLLRQLRTIEHMARVTPPNQPVNDPTIITPTLQDLTETASRPVFSVVGQDLVGADGSLWTPTEVARAFPAVSLLGDANSDAFWAAVEALNRFGVVVIEAEPGAASPKQRAKRASCWRAAPAAPLPYPMSL